VSVRRFGLPLLSWTARATGPCDPGIGPPVVRWAARASRDYTDLTVGYALAGFCSEELSGLVGLLRTSGVLSCPVSWARPVCSVDDDTGSPGRGSRWLRTVPVRHRRRPNTSQYRLSIL